MSFCASEQGRPAPASVQEVIFKTEYYILRYEIVFSFLLERNSYYKVMKQ